MGDTIMALKCVNCGADLNVPAGRERCYCTFCGAENIVRDMQHRKLTVRQVDDARIREADVQQTIRLKELEIELERLKHETMQKRWGMLLRLLTVTAYFLILAGILFLPLAMPVADAMDIQPWLLFYLPLGIVMMIFCLRKK